MTLGCSQSIELMSRASWCNRKVTGALWSHISLQKPSNSTKINEWGVLRHIWWLGDTVPPKRKSDIFVVKTCRMVLKLSESIVLMGRSSGCSIKSFRYRLRCLRHQKRWKSGQIQLWRLHWEFRWPVVHRLADHAIRHLPRKKSMCGGYIDHTTCMHTPYTP